MSLRFIDKYEIVSTLGRGSMGVVYKAKDPEIGRLVAIKTLKSVFMGDDAAGNEALQRFRQESRSAGKLHHPNIVTIFEAGRTDNGSPFIVMEYIEGKSLESMLAEGGAIDTLAALHYLAQIASAIDYAHSQNVIHRDIKPSNIIVDARHRPFLLDFGVAKLSDTSLTPAGTVVGTPSYMSPEQIRGAQLDGRTDLFSFAVVAFEVFSGSRPFPGADFTSVVSNIIHKEPLTFSEVNCSLPDGLEKVLLRGLSKEREKRYASALEFIDAAAQVFGVVLDGTGLAGGYTPGLKLPDPAEREALQRTRAQTVVGSFFPGSRGDGPPGSSPNADEHVHADATRVDAPRYEEPPTPPKQSQSWSDRERTHEVPTLASESSRKQGKGMGKVVVALLTAGVVIGGIYTQPELQKKLFDFKLPWPPAKELVKEPVKEPEVIKTSPAVPEPTPMTRTPSKEKATTEFTSTQPSVALESLTESGIALLKDEELSWLLEANSIETQLKKWSIVEAGKRSSQGLTHSLSIAAADSDFKIRAEALKALGRLPHVQRPEAFDVSEKALRDNEFIVRGFAAKILASIRTPAAIQLLENRAKEEKNAVVLKVLNDALSQLQSGSASGATNGGSGK